MKIKKRYLIIGFISHIMFSQAISIPIEVLSTEENFYYQHSFHKAIGNTKFSFFNLTSIKANYKKEKNSYLVRNQLFYKLHKNWNLGFTGEITNTKRAFRFGLQYALKKENLVLSLYSNITIANATSYVNMLYLEYKLKINQKYKFYSRFQIQTITSFKTNIKYSNLYRLGIAHKSLKFGLGTPWFDPLNIKGFESKYIGLFIATTF